MPPKRGRPTAAAKGKAPIQQQLLPLIKKPLELIGDHVNVPGAFWEGRMSAAEKETLYKCVVRDHSALHKFIDGPMRDCVRPSTGCKRWARRAPAAWSTVMRAARSSGSAIRFQYCACT